MRTIFKGDKVVDGSGAPSYVADILVENGVIAGIGSFEGPIIGTVIFFLIRSYLSELGVWHFIILGALSIAVAPRSASNWWSSPSSPVTAFGLPSISTIR